MDAFFEFEKPIVTLEKKLKDLKELSSKEGVDLSQEIAALEKKVDKLIDEVFHKLSPWEKVQLSRHPNRPYSLDYIENLFPTFMELHGDRAFGEDPAIVSGIANWPPTPPPKPGSENKSPSPQSDFSILILAHQKGRTTKQKMLRNFGMAKPEGYRKAVRLMELAERSRIPILTFIDTPGAYPGIETEERGQAQAIAECIRFMFSLTVPIMSVVIGEGGSGGALAIGVGNKVLAQEYSTYSVISPEGCASILWSDSKMAERASECLRMNPPELLQLGVIDGIIPEPKGGAHRDWYESFQLMQKHLIEEFEPLLKRKWRGTEKEVTEATLKKLRDERILKFRQMGSSALGQTV